MPRFAIQIRCADLSKSKQSDVASIHTLIELHIRHSIFPLKNKSNETIEELKLSIYGELLKIFQAISKAESQIIRDVLLEGEHKPTTQLEAIIDIFCAAVLSPVQLKLLGEGTVVRGVVTANTTPEEAQFSARLISNFGFCATRYGTEDECTALAKRANLKEGLDWNYQIVKGEGAILSSKEYTSLLNVVWAIAIAIGRQDAIAIPKNKLCFSDKELFDDPRKRPTMLSFEMHILHLLGYRVISTKEHGIMFLPPEVPVDISKVDIFAQLGNLMALKKPEFIKYMREMFSQHNLSIDTTTSVAPLVYTSTQDQTFFSQMVSRTTETDIPSNPYQSGVS